MKQYVDGEYLVTVTDSGAVIREINQAGKVIPPVIPPVNPLDAINTKLDKVVADVAEIKATVKPK